MTLGNIALTACTRIVRCQDRPRSTDSTRLTLNPLGKGVRYRKVSLRHKSGSLAIADDKRCGIFPTSKVERAALLAIKPRDLTRV